jgi:hypothetical protein
VQVAQCPHCTKSTPVTHLYQILCFAAAGTRVRSDYKYTWFAEASPECATCGKGVSVASFLTKEGAATTIPCASCGTPMPTFPAPAWLRAQLPTVLQVLGGDADVAREQSGADLVVKEDATKPIAMPCPSCGGGLTIGKETERTVNCQFCTTSVFIPDELWKRLHPVKTMLRWTLTYTGKLTCEPFDKFEANARTFASSIVKLIRLRQEQGEKFDLDVAIEEGRQEFQTIATGSLVELYESEAATLRPSPAARAPAPMTQPLPPAPVPVGGAQGKFPIGLVIALVCLTLAGIGAAVAILMFSHQSEPKVAPAQPAPAHRSHH